MRRRVVLVIGQLHQGGAEGQLVRLAAALASGPWEPSVACLSEVAEPHAGRLRASGVPVEVFARSGRRDLGRVVRLASMLDRRRADLVHSYLVGANAYAWAASRLAGRPRLVVSSRTTMPIPDPLARWIHTRVFRRADAVIANAQAVAAFTASYFGVRASRIRVVPNGVEVDAPRTQAEAAEVRRTLGIPGDALLVGTVGRLSKEKRPDLFVEAAAGLAARDARVRFLMVGDGPDRPDVEAAIRRAGLEDRIVLAGARSDVARLLAAFDVFLTTSSTEGLPNAVMEAMAAARPVVATAVGGTSEVIEDGVTGRLIPAGDPAAAIAAIAPLLDDEGLRARIGAAARARILERFSIDRMVAGTIAVYDELAGARGAGRAA